MISSLTKIKKRAVVLFSIFLACLFVLIFKIAYWQIVRGEELKTAARNQQTGSTVVTASRGEIYDRNGKALAESASVNTLVCNPQDVKKSGNAEVIATKLAPILNMEYDKIYSLLTKSNRYQVIKKRLSVEETEQIQLLRDSSVDKTLAANFKGVYFEEDSKRYYSYNVAPHVVGFTGYDNNGLQGIEMTFDEVLTGRTGSVLSAQTASGTSLDELEYESYMDAAKGADVVLTIDETIQHFLEKHLEQAVTEQQLKEGAAGIIMNPKTGEILAMATKPDFDLNNPYDVSQFEKYAIDFSYDSALKKQAESKGENPDNVDAEALNQEKIAAMRNKMWRNKAVSDTYEPGSTFKIITAAAALEEGVVALDSPFNCPGFKIVGDRKINCHKTTGHGQQTFLQGVQHSCNPVFMELGLRLGSDKFMEYFNAFGLTEKTNIELIGESGSIYYKTKMSETDIATSAFGQGFQITPIQLVRAVSAVVNGGDLMKPQIVKEIRNENGVIKTYQPEVVNKVISKETSDTMREILESVVSSPEGSGKNAYVKGFRIGGKTGTSEKAPRGTDKRISSFIGFAPADDPEIVCLVMLDEPQVANKYGGTIAAPLAGEIMEDVLDYLGVERQYAQGEEPENMIEIPDLRGLSVEDAKKKATDVGFKIKTSGKGEQVVSQLPQPGVVLAENSMIVLYMDEQEETKTVTVPNLNGLSISDAKATLTGLGLNFEIVGAGQTDSKGAYAVKQSVAAGEKVAPSTVVGVEFRHSASD